MPSIETGSCKFTCFVQGVKKVVEDFDAETDMPLAAVQDSTSAADALREAAMTSIFVEEVAA